MVTKSQKQNLGPLKPPFAYYGGKTFLAGWILSHLPPHHTFVDLFGGGGSLILAKEPSPVEVFNDLNAGLTNFYSVLRAGRGRELVRRLRLTPYSRSEYKHCVETWASCTDPIERARRWFYVQALSFNGRWGAGMRYSKTASAKGMSALVSAYLTNIERIPDVAKRFRQVIVECLDFADAAKRYDGPGVLMFADIPYVHATRNTSATYVYECCLEDHKRLIWLALNSQSMWAICGYDHAVYTPLIEAGWRVEQRQVCSQAAAYNPARQNTRLETLWISPCV
ncbi:MAG: DNA adenine methylase [Firmicutes bacterium]|nr:DNA adenine methylase [Bacillota bacterium]